MIGFKPHDFMRTCGWSNWDEMVSSGNYNWSIKGSDQNFINDYVYRIYSHPQADSIVQHYIKGMPNTYLSAYYNEIPNIEVPNVPSEYNESNDVCGHIGAAGWYETALFRFFEKYRHHFDDLISLEKEHSAIFYWSHE
jgi:hypothetical protein